MESQPVASLLITQHRGPKCRYSSGTLAGAVSTRDAYVKPRTELARTGPLAVMTDGAKFCSWLLRCKFIVTPSVSTAAQDSFGGYRTEAGQGGGASRQTHLGTGIIVEHVE
ncbi:unnamed protein product [Lepidochelys kempii]